MNKIVNRILLVVLILCLIVFICYFIAVHANTDTTAPVISFDSDTLSMSVYDEHTVLLNGVSAQDRKDGDVTSSILIEGISSIREDHCATVTYAAFDQSGNVTKAERTIQYTDYDSPKFALSAPLIFRSGSTIDLFDYVTVTDLLDGDLSKKVKASLVGGTTSISQIGVHQVELRVTNSMGDTARLTVPVDVYQANEYNATVTLTDYLIYLKKGDTFLPKQYLESLDTGFTEYSISQLPSSELSVDIQSDVQTDACGTYSVTYTVSYENYTGYSRIIVVVEE